MFLVKKVILIILYSELYIMFSMVLFHISWLLAKYSDWTLENDGFSSLQKASEKAVQNEFGFDAQGIKCILTVYLWCMG